MHLRVGDFVAIFTHHMSDGKLHWTLGSVETPPYLRDVEICLWERQRAEYYDEDDTPTNPETAELMKRISQVKQDLQNSILQAEDLTQRLRDRRAAIMQKISEADDYMAETKALRDAACVDVENISDCYWQELKSYRLPPRMVSLVIRAVMLLLSEDDARSWSQMQRVLRESNFKRRITGYDPYIQLSSSRRDYILQECVSKRSFRYDRALQGSMAVGPIYYWVLAQLDSGEALSQKNLVDEEKITHQKELRGVLRQISEQQKRIAEYQELMDDLDDQLHMCNQSNSDSHTAGTRSGRQSVPRSRSRCRVSVGHRYAESFAAREGKEYLRPAFYTWKPTDRIIIVLRKNIVCNFGAITLQEKEEGYNMSDMQIHILDAALMRHQRALEAMGDGDEEIENEALEEDIFKQNDEDRYGELLHDEGLPKEHQYNGTTEGQSVPEADDTTKVSVSDSEATSKLQRKFDGKNWQRVLHRKRDAIEAAFTEDSAECLEVPAYYISIDDLTLGSLIVDFSAQHDGQRSDVELQGLVDAFGYLKVMSLYEEDDVQSESDEGGLEHQMKFGGGRWIDITPEHRDDIKAAFLVDTSAATGAREDEIAVHDIRADAGEGLTVDYSMLDKSRDPEEVQEQVDAYAYPAVWAVYQRLAGLEVAGSNHQVRFRGERWADIMLGAEEAIKRAFAEDTADALKIALDQVIPDEISYENGLTVPYTVSGCLLNGDEVDARAEDYHYPRTWALYDRLVAQAVGATYQKSFEGEHWEMVLHVARPEVSEAFCLDTAKAVKSSPSDVLLLSVDTDQDRLLVSYNIADTRLPSDKVWKVTGAHLYPSVWALYYLVVAEEAEGTENLSQSFDGAEWEAIHSEMPRQVCEAFINDVATATRVDLACVMIHNVKTSKKGMTVVYGINRKERQPSYAMRKAAREFDYPVTWSLYEAHKKSAQAISFGGTGERESGALQRRFEGDDWDILVEGCPEELNDAFCVGAARVLGVSKQSVVVIGTEIGSLIVRYRIVNPPYEDNEINQRIEEDEFPEMLRLYRSRMRASDEGERGAAANDRGMPKLHDLKKMQPRVFDGGAWSFVVANRRPSLHQAFVRDTSDALKVRAEQVVVEIIVADECALQVQYSVLSCPSDETATRATLEDYMYPFVWKMYPTNDEDLGKYGKSFDGAAWERIVASREEAVRGALVKDVADALKTNEHNVVIKSLHTNAEGLTVRFNVVNGPWCKKQAAGIQEYAYPNVWALHKAEGEGAWVTTSHQVGFDGDDWVYVLAAKHDELAQAFRACTRKSLDVAEENISDALLETSEDALLITFDLKHPKQQSEDEINDKLANCDYMPVWDLYIDHPYHPDEQKMTSHEIGFEGEGWGKVLEAQGKQLENAMLLDTAEAVEVAEDNITLVKTTFENQNLLIVQLQILHPVLQDEELIKEQLGRYPYERVWALYCPEGKLAEGTKYFNGVNWARTIERDRDGVAQAFREDTAAAMNVRPEDVEVGDIRTSDERMEVEYTVQTTSASEEVRQTLQMYPYPKVWDHYFVEEETVTTLQDCGFEGEDWDYVWSIRQDAMCKAFADGVASALQIEPTDIQDINMEKVEDGIVLGANVTHPLTQDYETIQQALKDHAFEELWALYETRPYDPNRVVRTEHIISFEGDEWGTVLESKGEEVVAAIREDTASALDVLEDDVVVVQTSVEPAELTTSVMVSHSALQDDELINEQLSKCEYERVWALYADALSARRRQEDTTGFGGTGERESGALQRRFEGDDWDIVVEGCPEELNDAFCVGAARVLGVSKQSVVVIGTEIGSLIVRYRIVNPPYEDSEINQRIEEDEFPEMLRLYRSRMRASDEGERGAAANDRGMPDETTVTTHQDCRFEGVDWDYVWSIRQDAMCKAFADGVASALQIEPTDIQDINMEKVEDGIVLGANVTHPLTQDYETIQQALKDHAFEELWALYETRPYDPNRVVRTEHIISFEGDEWGTVLESKGEEVVAAIREDTASALDVLEDDVVVVQTSVEPAELTATVMVSHSALQDDELINERLSKCEYERVWALYCPEGKLAEGTKYFNGVNWARTIERDRDGVAQAFREDTAAAMNVRPEDVEVGDIRTSDERMEVEYTVQTTSASEEVRQTLQMYPYPKVWDHYFVEEVTVTTHQDCRFEGVDWDYVWSIRQDAMCKAFADGVASALQIEPTDIQDINMEKVEDGIVLGANVTHPLTQDYETIQQALKDHAFEELWALYETRPYDPNRVVRTEHIISFEGDEWGTVLESKGEEVVAAIREDTASALDVLEDDVVVVQTSVEPAELTASVMVSHSALQDDGLINERLSKCEYERVWALYCPEGKLAEGTKYFNGVNWARTIERDRDGVAQAFREDTAAAMNVRPEDVEVGDIRTSDERMEVEYTVQTTSASEEVRQTLQMYPYPKVWDHYFVEEETVTTLQDCRFEGVDWDYVWSIRQDAMCKAFADGVASALQIEPTDIQDINMEKVEDGIVLGANVTHPLTQDYETIQQALKDHAFEELWALYETRPYDPNRVVRTEHIISFEGDEWGTVLESKGEEVVAAIREDTASALDVLEDDVVVVQTSVEPAELTASVMVSHSALQDDGLINERLCKCEYERVWALYADALSARRRQEDTTGSGGTGERESGRLQRVFSGDDWGVVLEGSAEVVKDAFCKGVADSVRVPKSDVVVLQADVGRLIVDYRVSHSNMEDKEINENVAAHEFPELMEMYRARLRGAASRQVPEGEDVSVADNGDQAEVSQGYGVVRFSVGFEGALWERIVRMCTDKLVDAFRIETANCLGTVLDDIHVVECVVSAHMLLVHFSARHHKSVSVSTLSVKIDEHPYKDVWALHEEAEVALAGTVPGVMVKQLGGVHRDTAMKTHPGRQKGLHGRTRRRRSRSIRQR
ncbi:hypothetical protein JKF63_04247 [Porcisia hertigi]|uniref:Flagellar attachment zone protein 1 conserved domain-containing protein n=1 Tax=Porcisia hertigi TaxID=2761500 RepID=A0A836HZS6_9TRYP|nr:hypothetical protein JKF63_04247 [Porcisia hertigi]